MLGEEHEASASQIDIEVDIDLTVEPQTPSLFDAREMYAISSNVYLAWVKPTLDRVIGVIALVLLSPILLGIGAAIWATMGGPTMLRQERVGRHGQPFGLYKFRTMEPDRRLGQGEFVGEDRRLTHKSPDDPRITGLGRWLRATRLDELPQFINVVQGDLSLVGPRPEMVHIVNEYEVWQHRRHAVKPGVTGIWQISDRGEKLLRDCTEMELEYLVRISLTRDLRIMVATIPAMIRGSGI